MVDRLVGALDQMDLAMSGPTPYLAMWVVYRNPLDHPDTFVVREWRVEGVRVTAQRGAAFADTLEEAREVVPAGHYNLGRNDHDDPVIVEVWV